MLWKITKFSTDFLWKITTKSSIKVLEQKIKNPERSVLHCVTWTRNDWSNPRYACHPGEFLLVFPAREARQAPRTCTTSPPANLVHKRRYFLKQFLSNAALFFFKQMFCKHVYFLCRLALLELRRATTSLSSETYLNGFNSGKVYSSNCLY